MFQFPLGTIYFSNFHPNLPWNLRNRISRAFEGICSTEMVQNGDWRSWGGNWKNKGFPSGKLNTNFNAIKYALKIDFSNSRWGPFIFPISIRICPGASEIEFRELLKEFAPQKLFKIEIGGPEAEIGKINGSQAEKLNTNSDAIKNVLKIDFSNFLPNLTWTLRNGFSGAFDGICFTKLIQNTDWRLWSRNWKNKCPSRGNLKKAIFILNSFRDLDFSNFRSNLTWASEIDFRKVLKQVGLQKWFEKIGISKVNT